MPRPTDNPPDRKRKRPRRLPVGLWIMITALPLALLVGGALLQSDNRSLSAGVSQAEVENYAATVRKLIESEGPTTGVVSPPFGPAASDALLQGLDRLVAASRRTAEQPASEQKSSLAPLATALAAAAVALIALGLVQSRSVARATARAWQVQSLLRTLVEQAREYAIFVISPSGEVQTWNDGAKRIKGYDHDEIVGEHFSCFYTGEDLLQGRPERLLRQALQAGGVEDQGWRVRKDGSRFWASVSLTPLRDDRGRLLGFSKITRDLTEQKVVNERFKKSLEAAPIAMLLIDRQQQIVLANAETERLFGRRREELLGASIHSLFVFDAGSDPADRFKHIVGAPSPQPIGSGGRFTGTTPEGRCVTVEVGVSTIRSVDETLAVVAIADVTQVVASRSEAEESERRFTDLADSAPLAMWVTDDQAECVWLNHRWREFTGQPLEEGVGTGWIDVVHPDDRDDARAKFLAAVDRQEPFTVRYRLRRQDGDFRWHTAFGHPRRDADGQFLGHVGLSVDDHDATQAKENLELAHESLKESEAIHRSLIDQSYNFVGLMTLDGVLIDANRTALKAAGVKAEDVVGKPFEQTPWWSHSESLRERLRQAIAKASSGQPDGFEATHLSADGEVIHVDFSLTPVMDESGQPIYLIPEGRNVSLHRRKERELIEKLDTSNRDLEQFAYIASHDLQEPLRKISAYCNLLLEEQGDRLDDDGRDCLRVAIDGADRLKRLVKDLLAYSRGLAAGVELSPVSAEECLDEALDNLEIARTESLAEIVRSPLPSVVADRSQFVRLLQNLIGNAIKYRGEQPPRIEISSRPLDEAQTEHEFCIRDNGIGIAPEHHEQVFGIFQRLHDRREYSGTGIGLAICKRIVQRTGGRIWVESAPGSGSAFYFTTTGIQPEVEHEHHHQLACADAAN